MYRISAKMPEEKRARSKFITFLFVLGNLLDLGFRWTIFILLSPVLIIFLGFVAFYELVQEILEDLNERN